MKSMKTSLSSWSSKLLIVQPFTKAASKTFQRTPNTDRHPLLAWREAPHNHADQPDIARPKRSFIRTRRLSTGSLCARTHSVMVSKLSDEHRVFFNVIGVVAIGSISTPILVLVLTALGWKARTSIKRRIELENKLRDDRIEIYGRKGARLNKRREQCMKSPNLWLQRFRAGPQCDSPSPTDRT